MIASIEDAISCIKNTSPDYKLPAKKAVIATILAAGAAYTPWETTRIISITVLAEIGYGITNEMISSYGCAQHFAKGHIADSSNLRNRPIQNLHPSLNAIINGMLVYWRISVSAGAAFSLIARVPCTLFFTRKILSAQITPYLAIGITAITLITQVSARAIQRRYNLSQKVICSNQHAISYGLLATHNILLGITLVTARIGLIKL